MARSLSPQELQEQKRKKVKEREETAVRGSHKEHTKGLKPVEFEDEMRQRDNSNVKPSDLICNFNSG